MSWVRVPPEAANFFKGKVTALGVLCCFALFVCLTLLASFFLPSHLSFKNMYMYNIIMMFCSFTHCIVHYIFTVMLEAKHEALVSVGDRYNLALLLARTYTCR